MPTLKQTLLWLVLGLMCFSCENLFFEEEVETADPFTNFDYLWQECDEKYAYFTLKNIDWLAVRERYRSQLHEGMSQDSLFNVMGAMLSELRDDHTNLISPFNISSFGVRYLGQDNFDFRLIEDKYIGTDYYRSGPFIHDFLAQKQVGYIRFPAFSGAVDNFNLDFILNRYRDTQGLILDLRENGGGSPRDMFNILSRFIDQETIVYYSRIKNGAGKDDFSEALPASLEPSTGIRYSPEKKVIVLTDLGTYSAGSFTALATKALPNVILVGDTTGGGLGLPNGGQLPNGWLYRFSVSQALILDLRPDYENGVPPDILAFIDWNDRTKDEVLERALEEILE
ncbi:MAG: S41 family peptidase [Bacteroidota bacterium]